MLSGLLSVDGKKVLHMDREGYYGGASASLNLTQVCWVDVETICLSHTSPQLYKKFRDSPPPESLGRDRDYAVDLIPKFILASGQFTQMLVKTDVTRYLEFKQIAGSYVLRDGRIAKVPSNEREALTSSLMGLFEKRRARSFFQFLQNWRDDDPTTHQGECFVAHITLFPDRAAGFRHQPRQEHYDRYLQEVRPGSRYPGLCRTCHGFALG